MSKQTERPEFRPVLPPDVADKLRVVAALRGEKSPSAALVEMILEEHELLFASMEFAPRLTAAEREKLKSGTWRTPEELQPVGETDDGQPIYRRDDVVADAERLAAGGGTDVRSMRKKGGG
jgi:hypothetical protein